MPDYRKAIYRPNNPNTYDGNGKIHQSEIDNGIKLVPDKNGKGYRKVGNVKGSVKLASFQDSSDTKTNEKIEKLEKENSDWKKLVADLEKRLRKLEDGDK
jgi:hypothetical protein